MRSTLTAAAVLALAAQLGRAQGVSAPAPAAPAPIAFKYPRVERRTLPNGLRLVIVENHSVPLVSGRIVLDADSLLADPPGKEGLLQFDLAMLPEGTATLSAEQIAAKMAEIGNEMFIGQQLPVPMGQQVTIPASNMSFTVTASDLAPALSLVADLLSHPTFPIDAIDRVRNEQLATLRNLRTRFGGVYVPLRIFHSLVRGGVPPRGATESGLAAITRQDLVDFHSQYIRPQLTTLVLVGDVNPADVSARAERAFGGWPRGGAKDIAVDSAAKLPSTTIYLFDRPGAQQSAIVVGTLGPPRTAPDRPALLLLNAVFDQATNSRLGENIRSRHGYAYTVTGQNSASPRTPAPMVFAASSSVAPAKTDSALIEWMSEIRGVAARPPTDSEMNFARGLQLTGLPSAFETPTRTSQQLANVVRSGGTFDDSYAAKLLAVKPSDVSAAAAKYLDPAHLTIVIAGDRKVIEAPLRAANIAPVVIVDENGKPVP